MFTTGPLSGATSQSQGRTGTHRPANSVGTAVGRPGRRGTAALTALVSGIRVRVPSPGRRQPYRAPRPPKPPRHTLRASWRDRALGVRQAVDLIRNTRVRVHGVHLLCSYSLGGWMRGEAKQAGTSRKPQVRHRACFVDLGTCSNACSPGWTRTTNPSVNSRMLCQLSYRGLLGLRMHAGADRWMTLAYRGAHAQPE